MRILFCRLCAGQYNSIGGDQPAVCPHCHAPAHWTVDPMPQVAWHLTWGDRVFLRKRCQIDPEDEDDGA